MSTPTPLAQIGFLQHRPNDLIKNRYQVLNHLGGGNFGSVYRVRDSVVGNFLACKEMHVLNDPQTARDERALGIELFKREALNLATLRHPHIPAAYFEQEDGAWNVCPICGLSFADTTVCPNHNATLIQINQRHYLMMDLVDGATLEELAIEYSKQRGRPLPERDCIEWIAQIASAVRALHALGIVHRDIKPDNITIRASDNKAILLDFGLTKKIEEAGGYGTLRLSGTGRFGTLGYAPHDPQEQQNPEARSDIYALGMTMLRLLTSRDPQDADDLRELQTHAPRHFNDRISVETERIIQRATAWKKTERYENVAAFLADLNDARGNSSDESSTRSAPFIFAGGFRAREPKDFARALETYPQESLNYLMNGMFGEWLRQNGLASPALAAQKAAELWAQNPPRALEIFRRSLIETSKLTLAKTVLKTEPNSLSFGEIPSGDKKTARLKIRNVGAGFLWGKIALESEEALRGLSFLPEWDGNETTIEIVLDTSQETLGGHLGSLVLTSEDETVRVPISYNVAPLSLQTVPQKLDFGTVVLGSKSSLRLVVRKQLVRGKTGGGEPRGNVVASDLPNVEVPTRFNGEEVFEVVVRADKPQSVARSHSGALFLDTNGGRLRVPVSYKIALPISRWLALVLGSAIQYSIALGALRLLYAIVDFRFATAWLWNPQSGAPTFVIRNLNPLFAGAVLGLSLGFWLRRSRKIGREFQAPLPYFGLLAGVCSGWGLAFVGHWGVWVLGDWLLFGLHRVLDFGRFDSPPVVWAIVGAIGGALWGLSRALSAIGFRAARPLVLMIFGVTFLALFINALLATP